MAVAWWIRSRHLLGSGDSLRRANGLKTTHSLPLNTNHFSKGVYLVKMISDFGIENQKLIVQ